MPEERATHAAGDPPAWNDRRALLPPHPTIAEAALGEGGSVPPFFYETTPFLMGIGEVVGGELVVVSANRRTAEFFRQTSEGMVGRTGTQLGTPREIEDLWLARIQEAARRGEPVRFEYQDSRGPDLPWLGVTVAAIPVGTDRDLRYSFVAEDITERKQAEAALRESEERLRLALEATGLGIHDFDPVSGHIRWDERVRELWGVGPDEPIDYDLFMGAIDPDDRERTQAAVARALDPTGDGEYRIEYRVTSRADHRTRWVAVTGQTTFDDGRAIRLVGTVQDITARKRIEGALSESEARQAFLLRLSDAMRAEPDIDAMTEAALRLLVEGLRVDRAFLASLDATEDRVDVGPQHQRDGLQPVPPALRPSECPEGSWQVPKDGLVVDDIRVDPRLTDPGRQSLDAIDLTAFIFAAVRRGEETVDRALVVGSARPRDWTGSEVALVQEAAERTWAAVERARAEAALRQTERELRDALAARDQFLGFISHELRTPMTVILGMSRILARRLADGAERDIAADVAASAEELNDLIDSLLTLARLEGSRAHEAGSPCHLGRVIERVLERQRTRDPLHEYIYRSGSAGGTVDGDETWLERVLVNLIGNAAKYSPPGREVTILLEDGEGRASVRVLDEGDGLDEDEVERLFEPFYRGATHAGRIPGAGLGLAVSRRIVESMHGRMWARKRPGGGAEFGFTVPSLPPEP